MYNRENHKTLLQYFSRLFEEYNILKKQIIAQPVYKLEGEEYTKKDQELLLVVQVIGKNIFFKINPEILLSNEKLLKGFSPLDVKTITTIVYEKKYLPKYRIIDQVISKDAGEQVIIEDIRGNVFIKKPVVDFCFKDKEMISKLSPDDAFLIGFSAGNENSTCDKYEMQKAKEKNKEISFFKRLRNLYLIK